MPNDNTHTLLPCPFCGGNVEQDVEQKYNWRGGIEPSGIGAVYLRHHCGLPSGVFQGNVQVAAKTMAGIEEFWNTRTPAEPKAGDWEKELDQLHDALGLLKLGDHPDKVFGEYVFPLFRAISSAASQPKAGDWGLRTWLEGQISILDRMHSESTSHSEQMNIGFARKAYEDVLVRMKPTENESRHNEGCDVDFFIASEVMPHVSKVKGTIYIEDATHFIKEAVRRALSSAAPRITEEMVERVAAELLESYGKWVPDYRHAIADMKESILALLRQQGPQRSEDQQGAERKWISLDECDWDDETPVYACFEERNRGRDFVKTKPLGLIRRSIREDWPYHSVYVCKRIEDIMPPFTPTQTEE